MVDGANGSFSPGEEQIPYPDLQHGTDTTAAPSRPRRATGWLSLLLTGSRRLSPSVCGTASGRPSRWGNSRTPATQASPRAPLSRRRPFPPSSLSPTTPPPSTTWHIGVRVKATKKLSNFLCVHNRLRSKRLAPVMIKEVTRRVHLENIWPAAYTAGVVLPTPFTTFRYWHRSLNPKKLIDVVFSRLGARMTMSRTIRLDKLPVSTTTTGLRKMELRNVPTVTRLLREYLSQYVVAPDLDETDVDLMQLIEDYFCQYCDKLCFIYLCVNRISQEYRKIGKMYIFERSNWRTNKSSTWHQKECVIPTSKEKKQSSRQAKSIYNPIKQNLCQNCPFTTLS
ncbi:unnamed protein product [Musa acuminata subsp. malaccensis]|uniref:Glycylpeptide N-tetradecanoyltransferase n=1 Tax=Musa acuminata subsp. malaccensis TaxID=214687 RepID=A0A804JP18_MUSAM|nr:unnamed protein product [Musa acuminata subsp. malaccensis]